MELFKSDFETINCKNFLVLRSNRINNNIFQTPKNFKTNIKLKSNNLNLNLTLNQVVFKKNLIIFRFNPIKNNNIPKDIKNAKLIIENFENLSPIKPNPILVKPELSSVKPNPTPVKLEQSSIKTNPISVKPELSSIKTNPTPVKLEQSMNQSSEVNKNRYMKEQNLLNDLKIADEIRREIRKNRPTYPMIANPYIYTNVESGYSAKSFPYVYIQRYDYGPQPGRYQTTPQVAL